MRFLPLIVLLSMGSVSTQAQVIEDFEDGNLGANPAWTGDLAKFTLNDGRLQSNSSIVNDVFYLSTPSSIMRGTEWEFFVELQFSTSGNNFVDVWLSANNSNLLQPPNGYFVRIGGTPDEISLFRAQGTTLTKIIDGVDGRSQASSSMNRIWVKVTCDSSFNWILRDDNTGTRQNYFEEGRITDNTLQSGGHFGIRITQSTASFHNRHFFDDIYVGPIRRDTIPPKPISISATDSVSIEITFDEILDSAKSALPQNFFVNRGIGIPSSVQIFNSGRSLRLLFSGTFQSPLVYQVLLTGITDLSGNILSPQSLDFTFFRPFPFCLVISELLPDPTPQVGLPAEEFIEIFNPLDVPFSLQGFTLDDGGTRRAALPNQTIQPGEFIIVCTNSVVNEFTQYGRVIGVSNWPSLNNDRDTISLRDPSGNLIFRVAYDIAWYPDKTKAEGGYSFEIVNPDYRCLNAGQYNWLASDALTGGTPGAVNHVFNRGADVSPPEISTSRIADSLNVFITFNEPMDAASLSSLNNWSVSGRLVTSINILNAMATVVQLSLDSPLLPDSVNRVAIQMFSLRDCVGNTAPLLQTDLIYFPGQVPGFLDLLITEIFPIETPSAGLPAFEFVEIYNSSSKTVRTQGLRFQDNTTEGFLADTILLPGEYAILCPQSAAEFFRPFGKTIPLSRWPTLNNTGERIQILNATGAIIHSVEYLPKWYADGLKASGGWSLEMRDMNFPCEAESNWGESNAPNGGTPGKANASATPLLKEVKYGLKQLYTIDSLTIRARFDAAVDPKKISNPSNWGLSPDIGLPISVERGIGFNAEWLAKFSTPLNPGTIYTLTLGLDEICKAPYAAPSANATRVALAEPRQAEDLKLSEILFNPRTGGADFVEIYNNSPRVLDLKGLILANSNDGININSFTTLASEGLLSFPGDYLTFTDNPAAVASHYRVAEPTWLLRADRSLPSFPDRNGHVIITDTLGNWLENYAYHENNHYRLLKDRDGVSLERISLNNSANDPTNWTSAARGVGYATPTAPNSMSEKNTSSNGAQIWLSPETFSPDGDGNDDLLTIYYSLPSPGMMGNITIFDQAGRPVRKLAQNYYLEQSGSFSWRGDNDDGRLCTMGIYVIFTEIFDLTGNVSVFKNACVLATKF